MLQGLYKKAFYAGTADTRRSGTETTEWPEEYEKWLKEGCVVVSVAAETGAIPGTAIE